MTTLMQRGSRSPLPGIFAFALAACSSGPAAPPPDSCSTVPPAALTPVYLADPHYCMFTFASGLVAPRELAVAPNGDILVAVNSQVIALYDANGDGVSDDTERSVFATAPVLNHGLVITATHVYASSSTDVYRWPYATGDRVATGPLESVVKGIPTGGHATRTLVVDGQNRLYVSIGSASNVDTSESPTAPPATRALIRRYNLTSIPAGGYAVGDGEVFAYGLRNEVGLSIDSRGRMWGVENGRDNLMLGGDIHYDNPAEEVNLFDVNKPGRDYGYPHCWSEGIWMDTAMAKGPGTQHLDPDQPGGYTEAKCQDRNAVVPPAFALGAHLAPLDIFEYRGAGYPGDVQGDLFVTSHGSWNREISQVGRYIIRLKMGPNGPTESQIFLAATDGGTGLVQGTWSVRPVSLRVDHAGLLVFSNDGNGTVNKIGYKP